MSYIKTVGIVGRGAIGVIFGDIIQKGISKENIAFIANEDRVTKYQKNPLYCNGEKCDFQYCTNIQDFKQVDLLIFAVKFNGLNSAIELVKPFIKKDTIIISALNGILSEDIIKKTFENNCIIRCVAQKMDSVYNDNKVTFSNAGELLIGIENENQIPSMNRLIDFFDKFSVPYSLSSDIVHDQWSKLMLNCGLNQVCAAYNVPLGVIQSNKEMRNRVISVMKEVQSVAKSENIDIKDEEINIWLSSVDSLDPNAMPSMRQDVLAKRKTELELFSGTIIPIAKKNGVSAVENKKLYQMIKAIEESF